jgi:FkbM family methyltransferase
LISDNGPTSTSPALRAYRLVNRPYYLFRPAQLLTRLRSREPDGAGPHLLRAAWGSQLYCWPDSLGRAVARTGVYDLVVAETLARLCDPGETAVDAGANVGLMSNLLAHAAGPRGSVVCFEPHPLILQTLSRNVALWAADRNLAPVELRRAAVSAAGGTLPLTIDPDTFAYNKGTASLQATTAQGVASDVATVRLDEELAGPIGVMKLDVEMHELQALEGARSLLARKLIRDIVFEEHEAPPTPVTELLRSHGYTIIGVRQGLTGPIASAPSDAYRRQLWDPPALLATSDPERAEQRLRRRGWLCLGGRLRRRGAAAARG